MNRAFDPDHPEMMDRPQPVSPELEADLANLANLNAWFGSYGLIRRFLRCWLKPGRKYRLLDLATGGGDIPRMIVRWARRRGIPVQIDAVDNHPATLEIARRESVEFPEIRFIQADVRSYEDPLTYDVVCCSLALHHFSREDAAQVLRQARDLSHDRVLVADLERQVFAWFGVWLLTSTIFTAEMTKHDARLSVKRAFSYSELRELAQLAGWQNFSQRRFLPARQAIWMSNRMLEPVIDLAASSLDAVPG
jgi:SAM-dependent methyltransferase